MPIVDIVIDTNILMHANNNEEATQEDCIALINYLLNSTELVCIDTAIDVNQSRILHEYIDKLRTPGTTGRNFVERMLQWQRFKPVSKSVNQRKTKIINQNINHNKNEDKIFVKVTCNSVEKLLVSHDFEDFQNWKRDLFNDELEIQIVTASEINIQ